MQVYDEVTKTWKNYRTCRKIVLDNSSGIIEFGYTSKPERILKILLLSNRHQEIYETDPELFKGKLLFSKRRGMYFSPVGFSDDFITNEILIKGYGDFPYALTREYEAIENFDTFKGRQIIEDSSTQYFLSKYFNYTFGLEFETSIGYVPEDICYRDGLIPLRDGSITAPEYSTVILKGNEGISLLHQQIKTLKEYTNFNKECALHVHLGDYPLNAEKIFNLYRVCRYLEAELCSILPKFTFDSGQYKANGKDYCKKLPRYSSFEKMYEGLVGRKFLGSFTQAHPNDKERKRKWNIPTRYYWCNFINALCYQVNKTIEFRFLRPTYNFKKILLWLYIFNAILKYSEEYFNETVVSIRHILRTCYPKELATELCCGVDRLVVLTANQTSNGDLIGADVWMEDELFNDLKI